MSNNNTRKLTPLQELFLEHLFNTEYVGGDVYKAAEAAGITRTNATATARALKDEILSRTDAHLVISAPKAAVGLTNMLEAGNEDVDGYQTHKADLRLKVISDVLDRVGVAKKQDIGIIVNEDTPLFFIPAKVKVSQDERCTQQDES